MCHPTFDFLNTQDTIFDRLALVLNNLEHEKKHKTCKHTQKKKKQNSKTNKFLPCYVLKLIIFLKTKNVYYL